MVYGYIIIIIDILYFDKIITEVQLVPVKMLKITVPIFGKHAQRLVLVNYVIGFIPYF